MNYLENIFEAFEAAANLQGIVEIGYLAYKLDMKEWKKRYLIQLSKR